MKKGTIAACLIAFLSALMVFTTPALLNNSRIGLEFKGRYEILYVAEPIKSNQTS